MSEVFLIRQTYSRQFLKLAAMTLLSLTGAVLFFGGLLTQLHPPQPTSSKAFVFSNQRFSLSNLLTKNSLLFAGRNLEEGLKTSSSSLTSFISKNNPKPTPHLPKSPPFTYSSLDDTASLSYSVPTEITIPAIGVKSPLLSLGLNSLGGIQVPTGNGVDQAAWYKHSASPGSLGTSIIEGHVDTYKSGPSVFFNLGKLVAGDKIYVSRKDNSEAVFSVYDVQLVSKNTFPTQLFYETSVRPTLNLITCGGSFNFTKRIYPDNVIVFSRLIDVIN